VSLTYAALDARADALARRVAARVPAGAVVAVAVPRGLALPVALLGVMKAGCAYLPLDPAETAERVAGILAEADATLLVADDSRAAGILPLLRINDGAEDEAGAPFDRPHEPRGLAYVLATSGSTGRPKAVGVEHAGAAALLRWGAAYLTPEERARVLCTTAATFDVSVFELFGPLAWGGTLLLAADLFELGDLPPDWRPTLVTGVPSAVAEVLRHGPLPPSTRAVDLAGEPLSAALVQRIAEGAPGVRVTDLYGPTEATVYATAARRAPDGPETIGRPLAATRAYLLDEGMEPVPDGMPGELYLGGPGVARGYLGRPALTAARFVPDPFGPVPGTRLFRTGDRARFLADGSLVFLGRVDRQVKLRGRRVEPGEVEHVLAAHPGVEEVRVTVAGGAGGEGRLVAHLVLRPNATLDEVRAHARRRLPPHLVPGALHVHPALPRTPSGKVDVRALGDGDGTARADAPRRAPRTADETRLAALWSELLRADEVGIDDDFFELGGHSLLALRLAARVRDGWGVRLELDDLLEAPTVAALAALLARRAGGAAPLSIPRAVPLAGVEVDRAAGGAVPALSPAGHPGASILP
jgi:amino acid adenylation domain-containing protein